jgi:hypothetical protein
MIVIANAQNTVGVVINPKGLMDGLFELIVIKI